MNEKGKRIMTVLELSLRENELLCDTIESYLADLRMEIAETDSLDYREMLKEHKQVLSAILERIRDAEAVIDQPRLRR